MAKQVNDNSKFTGIRLPSSLKPVHYDLKLKPNLADFTFSGTVRIDYSSSEVPKCIVLNADELVISDGEAKAESGKNPLTSVTYSKTSETATLEFQDTLEPEGSVSLNFTGTLNDRMVGFYRTGFQLNDTTVYAATTQLEACEARKCFPCWDEPSFKATFSVTIVYNKYLEAGDKKYENVAISNMPEESRSGSDEELAVKFAKSPIMSTYLLAFIVGPFEFIEGHDTKRPIRVYTTPGKKEQGEFALEVACKSLRFYEDYFGVEYPLPKMDMIAVPDFSSGAMENWGLVTYRETCILFDPNNSATRTKQYIAIVVAHELAHQWFGNLVTMEWWTHLWLNEGFASFMEYLCVDHIYPEYDIWTQFVTDSYLVALDLDALKNSHPIEVPVKHPSEIDQIFDDISYNKGASVIRMLHAYIGDDSFRKGMKDYLTKFAYNNAVTEDLWDSLEAASNKPVRKLMSGWTSQKGFPWLSLSYAAEGDKVKIGLTQHKFTADGKEDEDGASWMIPISCVTSKEPLKAQELCLIDGQSAEVTLDVADSDWFKLNPNTIGLYRTAYPEEVLSKLLPAIRDQSLAPLDRLGLQNDLFALSKAGKASTVDLLKLLQAFKNEDNFSVWSSVDSCIGELKMLISNTDYSEMFDAYGRDLYSEIFKKVGWEPQGDETPLVAMTRALVLNRLVSLGEREVIDEAKERFRAHMSGGAQVPADLRAAVYRAVSAYGDDESFEGLFNIAKTAELSEERNRALRMLSFARSDDRLNQAIEYVMSDLVRNQDKLHFLRTIGAANPPVGWKTLQDYKDPIHEMYKRGHLLPMIVKANISNFASDEKADEVTEFFNQNKFPSAAMAIQQSIETIRLNASVLNRDVNKVKEFLGQRSY